jgi:hypothetical protein
MHSSGFFFLFREQVFSAIFAPMKKKQAKAIQGAHRLPSHHVLPDDQ